MGLLGHILINRGVCVNKKKHPKYIGIRILQEGDFCVLWKKAAEARETESQIILPFRKQRIGAVKDSDDRNTELQEMTENLLLKELPLLDSSHFRLDYRLWQAGRGHSVQTDR